MTASTTGATSSTDKNMNISDYFKTKESEDKKDKYLVDKNAGATMDKNDFLNLLVTQLRYQDPMAPSDNQQMAAQMAQFTSLEQTQNMAQSLEGMGTKIQSMVDVQTKSSLSMSNSSATALIGKVARLRQTTTTMSAAVKANAPQTFSVTAETGSSFVICDKDGKVVRTMHLDGYDREGKTILDKNGEGIVAWDGTTDSGIRAEAGSYTVKVVDAATGKQETGSVWNDAAIIGIDFDSEGPMLVAEGQTYRMDDLLAVANYSLDSGSKTSGSNSSTTTTGTTTAGATTTSTASTANVN